MGKGWKEKGATRAVSLAGPLPPPELAHTESPSFCLGGPSGKRGTEGQGAPGVETGLGSGRYLVSRGAPRPHPSPAQPNPKETPNGSENSDVC